MGEVAKNNALKIAAWARMHQRGGIVLNLTPAQEKELAEKGRLVLCGEKK